MARSPLGREPGPGSRWGDGTRGRITSAWAGTARASRPMPSGPGGCGDARPSQTIGAGRRTTGGWGTTAPAVGLLDASSICSSVVLRFGPRPSPSGHRHPGRVRWPQARRSGGAPPPTSAARLRTANDVTKSAGRITASGFQPRRRRSGTGLEETVPLRLERRRSREEENRDRRRYSVSTARPGEGGGRVQRERATRGRVRERRGPPS